MHRAHALFPCLLVALTVFPTVFLRATTAGAEEIWIEVDVPGPGHVEAGSVPLIEVRGTAGTVGKGALDLVVLIDASKSTAQSSGADLNFDGHVGGYGWKHRRSFMSWLRHPLRNSDPADSILFAELEAVRRLARKLDPDRTRLGVVAFAENAVVHGSVGAPIGQILRALEFIGAAPPEGRTNMAKALRVAAEALGGAAHPDGARRDRAIVLLSDGYPTVPAPSLNAAVHALQAALEVSETGVRLYTVGLAIPDDESGTLKDIAHAGRGAYAALDQPAAIVEALPNLDLQGIADVEVRNQTTGALARASHVWRDGSFSAFVRLEEGENRLAFTARGPKGSLATLERSVHFERRDPVSERDRELENARLERLRQVMQERTVRLAVERKIEEAKSQKAVERDVSVEVD